MLPETNVTAFALVSHPSIADDGEVVERQTEVLITGVVEFNQDKLQYSIYEMDCTDEDGGDIRMKPNPILGWGMAPTASRSY